MQLNKTITNPADADAFFMENVWEKHHREEVQTLSLGLLDAYVQSLSVHLGLSVRDTDHLAREMGYHAISAFVDTACRLKQKGLTVHSGAGSGFHVSLSKFFSEDTVQRQMGSSRVLRCRLANLILQSFGEPLLFADINQGPRQIRLEDLNLPVAKEERYWRMHYNLSRRIPNYLGNHAKAQLNQLRQRFQTGLTRIGSINLDRKYMLQLPDIQFVPLELDLDKFLVPVPIEARIKLYSALKEDFIRSARCLKALELLTGTGINTEFLELLLAFIILQGECLLCDTGRLHQSIDSCEQAISRKKIQALFSEGGWFRFQNAIIAAAGRRLKLPIIQFQSGGAAIYQIGKGFDWGSGEHDGNRFVDHMLLFGDWQYKEHQDVPKYHRVPDHVLSNSFNSYTKKRRRGQHINVMYSPIALSHLFSVENWLSVSSYDMSGHRDWIDKSFEALDASPVGRKVKLFVKVKGFGYTLFKEHPWMLLPSFKLNNISVKYLLKGNSSQYFRFVDLHLFCGPSTSFVLSMNSNIPSMVLWNPFYNVKSEYSELFSDLESASIICRHPKTFVNKLQLISTSKHWLGQEVQRARSRFCNSFAVTAKNWKSVLNGIILEKCLTQSKPRQI